MKCFRHILMDHKIFLKIFDRPQNIFLCSFLILTFSKFVWKFKWVWAENVQTRHQEDLRKIRHVNHKSNFLSYNITNSSKNPKINSCCILTLLLGFLTLVMGYKIHIYDGFSSVDFHYVKSVQIQSYFWSVFSCIRTEYGYLLRKSSYSVRIQENLDQK